MTDERAQEQLLNERDGVPPVDDVASEPSLGTQPAGPDELEEED
jgi:hypothetical protein